MSRNDPQMKIRLPEDLKSSVTEAAERNGRSINAEIVHRLQHTLIIIDEAHRTTSTDPSEVKALLEHFDDLKLGFTATPTPNVDAKSLMESIASGDEKKAAGLVELAKVAAKYYTDLNELGEKLLKNKKKESSKS